MKNKSLLSQKLNSQSGASILLALLFFIVCVVAGSVVLASASAAAGRLTALQDIANNQDQYAVDSAASVLKPKFEKEQVTVLVTGESISSSYEEILNPNQQVAWSLSIGEEDQNGMIIHKNTPDSFLESLIVNHLPQNSDFTKEDYLADTVLKENTSTTTMQLLVPSKAQLDNVQIEASLQENQLVVKLTKGQASSQIKGLVSQQVLEDSEHIESPKEITADSSYRKVYRKVIQFSWQDLRIGKGEE